MGHSPWGPKESDMTERLTIFSKFIVLEHVSEFPSLLKKNIYFPFFPTFFFFHFLAEPHSMWGISSLTRD